MRRIARALFIATAVLNLAADAMGQDSCSELRTTEKPGTGNDRTCPGNDPLTVFYKKDWEVVAATACKESNWKRQDNLPGTLQSTATGQCGNTPADTPPFCQGTVSGPFDMGFDEATKTHKVRAEQQDTTWNAPGCNDPASVFANASVPSEGCRGQFCCGGSAVIAECSGRQGDFIEAECACNFATPILLDMKGDGFQLTGFAEGVLFDLTSNGLLRQMSWTVAGNDDAFLFLDRNSNGIVDGGTELFGNHTPTPQGRTLNGFVALAVFDTNGDQQINSDDSVYVELQLWTDRNHNGRSEPSELTRLIDSGITAISVDHRESRRKDRHGNLFRYRARVIGAAAPFAYDVNFLLSDASPPISRRR